MKQASLSHIFPFIIQSVLSIVDCHMALFCNNCDYLLYIITDAIVQRLQKCTQQRSNITLQS